MKKHIITDEHIVAYLDGELSATQEFEQELRSNPTLASAVAEYKILASAMARSGVDNRFMLSKEVDRKTKNILLGAMADARKAAVVPARAPIASEKLVTAVRNVKYLWAKRTAMGFVLAGLAVSVWFNFNVRNEMITQVPVSTSPSVSTPTQSVPAAVAPTTTTSNDVALNATQHLTSNVGTSVRHQAATPVQQSITKTDFAVNTSTVAEAPPQTQTKVDPADIMISHRYAKLIKETRAVAVTDQDKVADQM
ncbi:MAG: hypothetical protein WCH46_00750 [bacterium]